MLENKALGEKTMCPYYKKIFKKCNLRGCRMNWVNIEYDCLEDNNYIDGNGHSHGWKNCSSYKNCSLEEKISKQVTLDYNLLFNLSGATYKNLKTRAEYSKSIKLFERLVRKANLSGLEGLVDDLGIKI